mgnify:CR=1 FL=1
MNRGGLRYPRAHDGDMKSKSAAGIAIVGRARDQRASDSVAQSILALPLTGLLAAGVARWLGIRREYTHV